MSDPRLALFGFAVLALLRVGAARAEEPLPPAPTEYDVKAAFLYSFAKYVQWPEAALDGPEAPFVVGVLGQDPFGAVLDQTLDGKSVLGHRIVVKRFASLEDAQHVQILFVAAAEARELDRVLKAFRGRPVLLAGESDDFAARGGIVGFKVKERRIRFDVNLGRAEEAQLKISSQLLKLATIVTGRP